MTRDFKGIWIPKEIWENKNLTVMEKLFLVEIDSLDNSESCFASNAHFSNHFELSKSRCTEVIKSLEKKGFVSIELERNKKLITKRIIKVRGIRKTEQGYSENRTGVFGKPKESNTLLYTVINTQIDLQKLISSNSELLEVLAMQLHIKIDTILKQVPLFVLHVKSVGEKYVNNTELFKHFGNWLRKQDLTNTNIDTELQWFIDMFNIISHREYLPTEDVRKLFAKQLSNGFTGVQMAKAVENLFSSSDKNRYHKKNNYETATPVHLLTGDNLNKYLNVRY